MGEHYKFEMIRSDDSAQITTAHSVKVKAVQLTDVVESFTDFLQACGFHRMSVLKVYQAMSDELSEV